jgi:hypothetical protein
MNLLPYQNVVFRSELPADEISKKLREHVKPVTAVSSVKDTKEYEGEVVGNNFNIQRIIQYRSSFLPVIKGAIIQDSNGTKINVKIGLQTIVLVGVCVLAGLAIVFFMAITFAAVVFRHFNFFFLAPFGFLIFLYLMTTIAFNMECSKSKTDLKKILQAEIEVE